MGLFATIGAAAGSLAGPIGTSVGGMIGSYIDGDGKNKGDTQMDEYTAYRIQKEKEWEATYGPIEENLVSHYEHLNAASHIAKGNTILEAQQKASMDRVNKELAARGLDVKGGISTSIMADSLNMLSKQKAELQLTADDYIAQQQQGFYNQMRTGKSGAGNIVNANAGHNYNQQAYDDKMMQSDIANSIDLGGKIYKGINGTQVKQPSAIPTVGGV